MWITATSSPECHFTKRGTFHAKERRLINVILRACAPIKEDISDLYSLEIAIGNNGKNNPIRGKRTEDIRRRKMNLLRR